MSSEPFTRNRLTLAAVVIVATTAALDLWRRYLPHWRQLWTDLIHDRSAHLDLGLGSASDLVHGRVIDLMRDVHWAQSWPPLHDGVMVGFAMLASGFDPRAAVLPGLLSYAASAVFAFLLARRLASSSPYASMAGVIAAAFALVSPAGRAFATDVMIEGPGACLTLVALHQAVRAEQDDSPAAWRALAIALAALFLLKYNYWLLVAASVVPLYARHRDDLVSGARLSSFRYRPLLVWHVVPSIVWLLLPGKLMTFLRMLWPGTNQGEFPATDRLAGIAYYLDAIVSNYQTGPWAALLVGVLVAAFVAAWAVGRLRSGAGTVVLFLALAAVATVPHPNRKARFLHSWWPVAWAAAGVGLVAWTDRRIGGRLFAYSAGAAVLISQVPGLIAAPYAAEGGVRLDRPSALELTDAYLPALSDANRPLILSNIPLKFLARWTYMLHYERGARPVTEFVDFDASRITADNATAFRRHLASGAFDYVVLVDVPRTSPWYVDVPGCAGLEQYRTLLDEPLPLVEVMRQDFPERGGVRVQVWRVTAPEAAP